MPPAPSNPAWAPQSWDRPSPQEEQPATPTDTALLERGITHEDAAPSVNIIDDPDPSAPDLIRAAASLLGRLFEQWDPPGAHGRTGSIQHHMSEHLARRVDFVLLSEFGKGAGLSEFRQALEDGYILCQCVGHGSTVAVCARANCTAIFWLLPVPDTSCGCETTVPSVNRTTTKPSTAYPCFLSNAGKWVFTRTTCSDLVTSLDPQRLKNLGALHGLF